MARPLTVVYVTYDGLEDPLGQSQVLPYVEGLAARGHRFEILSFEKPGVPTWWREPLRDGVRWTAFRYHRTPTVPATAWDMGRGTLGSALLHLLQHADLVHARSYVAASMALPLAMTVRLPLLFDMRGFWADEKVDGGAWPAGNWKVRAARRIERTLLRRARAIAVITLEAQRFLRDEYPFASDIAAPIHVIPTAADLRRFSPEVPPDPVIARQVAGARVLGYVGSLGTWYMGETMARFYLAWRDAIRRESGAGQPTRLLVVTHSDVAEVRAILEAAGASRDLVTVGVPHARVPSAIRCMEAGVSFRRPSPSSRAGAPVKIGETLACGVPVASNAVGDVARIFGGSPAGVLVGGTTEQELRAAAARLEAAARSSGIGADARRLARRWFDLDAALNAYDELYAVTVRRAGGATVDAGWPRSFPPRP